MFSFYQENTYAHRINYLIKETERRIELENILKNQKTDEEKLIALKNRIIGLKLEKERFSRERSVLEKEKKRL